MAWPAPEPGRSVHDKYTAKRRSRVRGDVIRRRTLMRGHSMRLQSHTDVAKSQRRHQRDSTGEIQQLYRTDGISTQRDPPLDVCRQRRNVKNTPDRGLFDRLHGFGDKTIISQVKTGLYADEERSGDTGLEDSKAAAVEGAVRILQLIRRYFFGPWSI